MHPAGPPRPATDRLGWHCRDRGSDRLGRDTGTATADGRLSSSRAYRPPPPCVCSHTAADGPPRLILQIADRRTTRPRLVCVAVGRPPSHSPLLAVGCGRRVGPCDTQRIQAGYCVARVPPGALGCSAQTSFLSASKPVLLPGTCPALYTVICGCPWCLCSPAEGNTAMFPPLGARLGARPISGWCAMGGRRLAVGMNELHVDVMNGLYRTRLSSRG